MAAKPTSKGHGFLYAIAIFKIVKGLLLALAAFGATRLFHVDIQATAEHWVNLLRIDPDNRYLAGLLLKLNLMHAKQLEELASVGVVYAALFLTEGTGLLFRQHWAEWLTVTSTALFLPLEIYELVHHFTVLKILLLLVNAAIVAYLIYRVRQRASSDE